MPTLHIDLQEGWEGDAAVVSIDDEVRRRVDSATTRTQIGLAAQLEEPVPAGRRRVTVAVPGRRLEGSHDVDVEGEHWLAVSIADDRLVFADQPELYGYL